MNINELTKLIKSFYKGETSPSEELLLRNYFNSNQIEEDLLDEKNLFLQFYESAPIEVPVALKSNLENLIDEMASEERKNKKPTLKRKILWGSVAASVAILLTVGIYKNSISLKGNNDLLAQKAGIQVTEADYIEAENAMRLISANFNKGMRQLDQMNESLEKTSEIINRTFKQNNKYDLQ